MRTVAFALAVVLSVLPFVSTLAQGPLDPPGAPAPMMKTLEQVEPRIPITNLPYTIGGPGSYYLTGNLTGASGFNGIDVNSEDVTIDLGGFSLDGVPGSISGIYNAGNRNFAVRNGTVRGWGQSGIDLSAAVNCEIRNVRALVNGAAGVAVGKGSRISGCEASQNVTGLFARDGSIIESSVARQNTTGISTENGCVIRGCSAGENTGDGITMWGKTVVSECQSFKNGTNGVIGGDGSAITKCTVSENAGDGIQVAANCQVRDNDCLENGKDAGDGAGIHATGNGNRIEGNHVAGADRGLDVDGTGNYLADNTVVGNTDNYDFVAGNQLNLLLGEVPESLDWPCSVRFAGTLTCASTTSNGISVNADAVTIDMAGHALVGPGVSSQSGINQSGWYSGLRVVNGMIVNWRGFAQYGLIGSGKDTIVESVEAVSNHYGIALSGGSIARCTASRNTSVGIGAGETVITESSATGNGDEGFVVFEGAEISDCVSSENRHGFRGYHARIVDCTAYFNASNGILAQSGCLIERNLCRNSGGAGIEVQLTHNNSRIAGNQLTGNSRGLVVDGTGNYVADNTVRGNTQNYILMDNNQLNLLLCEVPEDLNWPCSVTFAGTLTCYSTVTNGITVNADNVTIDMAGHALVGPGASSQSGINQSGWYSGLRLVNGRILNWRGLSQYGLIASGKDTLVEAVEVVSNHHGIGLSGGVISRCTANGNLSAGILADGATVVTESSATGNGWEGLVGVQGAEISHCTATGNRNGFRGSGAKIINCTAYNNTNDGILAQSGCLIEGNHCSANSSGDGIEVELAGINNRIDGNHLTGNNCNLNVQGYGNLIVRNTARAGVTANYSIAGGNDVGPIGLAATNMSPWANIAF